MSQNFSYKYNIIQRLEAISYQMKIPIVVLKKELMQLLDANGFNSVTINRLFLISKQLVYKLGDSRQELSYLSLMLITQFLNNKYRIIKASGMHDLKFNLILEKDLYNQELPLIGLRNTA